MKTKSTFFALLLTSGLAFSQSQRLVLVEEFTNASCGPCASANPAFNTLLNNNTAKATSIKYQVNFPGADPMNAQNPNEIQTQTNFYAIASAPSAVLDGGASIHPANVNQASIDNAYAVQSPFSMKLVHWFNAANDSIFIDCEVTCTQNITMTTPRLRVAMVEKLITFTSAPGSNGEKVFEHVMRKMYPSPNGTVLSASWSSGNKKHFSFKGKIPTYIYKKTEIATVAWIQDNANKNIKQSVYSPTSGSASALAPEADFTSDLTAPCDGLVNFNDQSALFPKSWLWDFGDGTTSTLQNPQHRYAVNGTYTVKLTATNINGNNQMSKPAFVNISLAGTAPTGKNGKRCGSGVVNLSATAAGSGTLNWYNSSGALVNTGATYSPTISGTTNFWVAEMTANALKFEGAATNAIGAGATYTASATQGMYFDVLKPCTLVSVLVYASVAGNRTIQVVDPNGVVVQTATVNIPNGQSTVTLNFPLNAGVGYVLQPTTLACKLYRNTVGGAYPYNASGVLSITGNTAANNAYYYFFYDWKVQQSPCASPSAVVSGVDSCSPTGIISLNERKMLTVSPNPSNGLFTVSYQAEKTSDYLVRITNTLGQIVYEEVLNNFNGTYTQQVDISTYGKGVYMLSISSPENQTVMKTIVN